MKTNHSKSPCTTKKCSGELPEIYCSREIVARGYIPHFITLIEALNNPLLLYMVKLQEQPDKDQSDGLASIYVFVDPSKHPYDPKELVNGAVNLGCKLFTLQEELEYFALEKNSADFKQTCRQVNCAKCSKRTHPYQQWALKNNDFFGNVFRPQVNNK